MRHISFDFWNTIGKPNKTYAMRRSQMLADVFGTSTETAKTTYSKVKGDLDHQAETHGSDHGYFHNLDALCVAFGKGDADEQFREALSAELVKLFIEHPPTIDTALIAVLGHARDMGITLSIGSNTNFIRGQTIMDHCVGRLPFSFAVFSDEIGCSKPNPTFFAKVRRDAMARNSKVIYASQITHVGDSDACDRKGALAAQMQYSGVRDADDTAHAVQRLLAQAAQYQTAH